MSTHIKSILYNNDGSGRSSLNMTRLAFLFYVLYYALSVLLSYYVIDYTALSVYASSIYFCYVLALVVGIGVGSKIYPRNLFQRIRLKVSHILFFGGIICLLILLYNWKLLLDKYGSFDYIISQSYRIRLDSISSENGIIPVWLNYTLCSLFVLWPIALESYFVKPKFYKQIVLLLYAIMILLFDLRTFGRIGMIYAIFCLVGAFIIHRVRMLSIKRLILLVLLYLGMMLPRIIRGGFRRLSYFLTPYSFKVTIPPILAGVMLVVIYYFSSLFALSEMLESDILQTHGLKTFAAFINLLRRILPIVLLEIDRVSLIDSFVNIPFSHNIFSIVGDLYRDFKLPGLVAYALFWGVFVGIVFNGKDYFSRVLQIILLAWLFYTPIYNMFNFGTFLLPLFYAIFLKLFFYIKHD